jgi:uncharacterized protein (DUF1778 family)
MAQQSTQFNIRMAVENKIKVERAARVVNQSMTEFAEAAVVARAEEVLERQKHILLSNRDFDRFVELMTVDIEPTETALREAAAFNQGHNEGSRYRW